MADFSVPLVIRGEVIEGGDVLHQDRSGGRQFTTPDVGRYIDQLVMRKPEGLMDLYDITLEDIYDYLQALGERLDLNTNTHWREAYEISRHASNLSDPVLERFYQNAGDILNKDYVREVVERRIGSAYLEGWVEHRLQDGRNMQIRAVGSRSVHVIAGNAPWVSVATLLRSAVTRNDAIIKAPSNDPLTAVALGKTMIEMAPDHPITKHWSVAYWKGGDENIERKIYQASNLEKICAWGGFASISHISKYLGPGLDLITLDPKNSTTLIGRETFDDEATMLELAARVATDIGAVDQEACSNTRVLFVETGTDAAGLEKANQFGKAVFDAIQALPSTVSNGPKRFDAELKSEINAILGSDTFYKVFTDPHTIEKTGAVIVSQMDEQVDFPRLLYGRVANVVPIDSLERAFESFSSATQSVGIYPPSLRKKIRDRVALIGGQMLHPVGYGTQASMAGPLDGVEAERRLCRWIVDSDFDDYQVVMPWQKWHAEQ